jgi:hypothetical protein
MNAEPLLARIARVFAEHRLDAVERNAAET